MFAQQINYKKIILVSLLAFVIAYVIDQYYIYQQQWFFLVKFLPIN